MSELKKVYLENVVPSLMKKMGYKNIHEVPKIEKIVINSSFGAEMDKTAFQICETTLQLSGQAPVIVKAKISVSNLSSGKECQLVLR